MIEWILSAVDEFEVLQLPLVRVDDPGVIRKQFKQLSLSVHPDKNKDPQATPAFRRLFDAMQKLSDPLQQMRVLRIAEGGEDEDENNHKWWEKASVNEME